MDEGKAGGLCALVYTVRSALIRTLVCIMIAQMICALTMHRLIFCCMYTEVCQKTFTGMCTCLCTHVHADVHVSKGACAFTCAVVCTDKYTKVRNDASMLCS